MIPKQILRVVVLVSKFTRTLNFFHNSPSSPVTQKLGYDVSALILEPSSTKMTAPARILVERLGESGATHDSQSASRSGVEAWVARNLNGWDDSDAGLSKG